MFLLIAYYVIFHMCLLFTLWRMNKYQSINQYTNRHILTLEIFVVLEIVLTDDEFS